MSNKRKLSLVIVSYISLLIISLSANLTKVYAEFTPPEVEVTMIQEYTSPHGTMFTMQPTPLSVVDALNFVEGTTNRKVNQLLKYVYPNYNDSQLMCVSADLEQSNKFLNSQGYKTKIVSGVLDYSTIKYELANKRPVIAYLVANGDYWIEQETSIIIFGIQKIKYVGQPENIIYMYRSLNHGDNALFSMQLNEIPLLQNESQIDPSANVTYSWASTLYGFTK